MTELVVLALVGTVLQVVGIAMIVLMGIRIDRQSRALELMLAAPKLHRSDDEEFRRRARAALRGGDEKEERGTPPLILDDEYEAAFEERQQKARDDG